MSDRFGDRKETGRAGPARLAVQRRRLRRRPRLDLPTDEADLKRRQEQLRQGWLRQINVDGANRFRDTLVRLHGEQAGKRVKYAEGFEVCEYGQQPSPQELRQLFPAVTGN